MGKFLGFKLQNEIQWVKQARGFVSNGAAQSVKCLKSDQDALINFKNGLEDPKNRLLSWQGSNCCQWSGISCENSTGAVVTVDLHNPHPSGSDSSGRYGFWNLSGEIRPSLVKLKSLRYLDLSFNTFNGIPIPIFFGSLENLQYLNLSNAGFSGTIPPNLGNLSSLEYLDVKLSTLTVDNLEWMAGLVSLKHLTMNEVDLSMVGSDSGPAQWNSTWLGELPNLRTLNFAGNNNLTASCFQLFEGTWKKIEVLDLASNKLRGELPTSFGSMTSLTHVDLFANNVEGGIPSSIDWLGQLKNLVQLDLEYNSLQGPIPTSLGSLLHLTELGLGGNQLNGTLPESLGQLSELFYFDVSSNHLTGIVNESHFSKLTKLKFLHLSSNSFTLNFSSNWAPPFQIQYLDMGSCHLGPSFPTWLKSQEQVTYLDFSNASISDVDLSSNLFEGPISLPVVAIELLDLSNNRFSGPIPINMGAYMHNQIFLSVSSSNITGNIPASLGELNSMIFRATT
ncbi:hypothetical protein SO802_010309 [Lithocarpus litseifolius]|uniref:Leucine-rich repeat-containing N-terminal plant-type domain-containing protein n=1 Tax=Lithocarpus litseifolius TaxID=425828 RepID=A0AAW2DG51_9ROSI